GSARQRRLRTPRRGCSRMPLASSTAPHSRSTAASSPEALGGEWKTMDTLPAARKGHHHAGTRATALLMGFAAITLAVMSFLHLSGTLSGGPEPFNRTHAGIAEALICVALSSGATMLFRRSPHARGVALASVVFAILGFIVGLNFTIRGGEAIDVAYHAT